ncbi:MAG: inorganic phosphate transporter [Thermodesulfobacteriota bacterium]|nr:inorganic phosphate transporter [Thermodesulfobacteriota bacterium]
MVIGPPFIFLLVGAGFYVGWNIGANDSANCIGTALGAGLISFKKAVILVSIFAFLGAVLQGHHVMETIGKGIVKEDIGFTAILVAMICSGFFVTLATFFKIPTSTSQAIVGGVVGVGLAVGAKVDFAKLITIAESWIICPILVMALAFALYHLLGFFLRKITISHITVQNVLGKLVILSACYVAYSIGANNAGNAVGPIANLGIIHPAILLCIGGIAIGVGVVTYGKKVADTVGKGITPLDIQGAFVAQMSSALGMHFYSMLGIPVSTSSAIVGAVMGVGLVKGAKAINKKTLLTILVGWVLTPSLAASASFLIFKVITLMN